MLKTPSSCVFQFLRLPTRMLVSAAKAKENSQNCIFEKSEEGFKLACIPQPACWSGLTRIVMVFNAGSRYEEDSRDRGLTHLLRRACGVSTTNFTSINLTRHFQQMGARIECSTTRDHMICTADIPPNLTLRAGFLLASMVTRPIYYAWELKDTVNKLMLKDIDVINRRNLSGLAVELLHEAAFGNGPGGCGLGRSLYSSADRVGSYSLKQIERFIHTRFTPQSTTLALSGSSSLADGMEILKEIKTGLYVHPPQAPTKAKGPAHGFLGGEIRRDLNAASEVYALLAWPSAGKTAQPQQALVTELAVRLLNGAIGRISHSPNAGQSCLAESAAKINPTHITSISAFCHSYSDHSLFGIAVAGPEASAVNERLLLAIHAVRSMKVTTEQLEGAKARLKVDLMNEDDSPLHLATNIAVHLANTDQPYPDAACRLSSIDSITVDAVNEFIRKAFCSQQAALSVVGLDSANILPLPLLLKTT